jgi:DNA (cytosine-5)-methyltransferase 1
MSITRQGSRVNDPYHLPMAKLFPEPKPAYDHNSFLKGCITTGGTLGYHPSGKRHFTPRELALLQSFPYSYRFMGGKTEAKKQIGNAFPPVMAERVYRTIAKTLEAFDQGLIGAEDDLSDLDALLERKGMRAPQARSTPRLFFGEVSGSRNLPYRSIERNSPSISSRASSRTGLPLVGKKSAKRATPAGRTERGFPSMNPMGSVLNRIRTSRGSPQSRGEASPVPSAAHDVIEISSDSEDEDM